MPPGPPPPNTISVHMLLIQMQSKLFNEYWEKISINGFAWSECSDRIRIRPLGNYGSSSWRRRLSIWQSQKYSRAYMKYFMLIVWQPSSLKINTVNYRWVWVIPKVLYQGFWNHGNNQTTMKLTGLFICCSRLYCTVLYSTVL